MKKKLNPGEVLPIWIYPERFADRQRRARWKDFIEPTQADVVRIGTKYMTDTGQVRYSLEPHTDENGNTYYLEDAGQYSPELRAYETEEAAMAWAMRERDLVKLRDITNSMNTMTGEQIKQMIAAATGSSTLFDLLVQAVNAAKEAGKTSVETDGDYLLCESEQVANALADILDGAGYVATTGQFEDDECYDDNLGGKWYVSV